VLKIGPASFVDKVTKEYLTSCTKCNCANVLKYSTSSDQSFTWVGQDLALFKNKDHEGINKWAFSIVTDKMSYLRLPGVCSDFGNSVHVLDISLYHFANVKCTALGKAVKVLSKSLTKW
jgi:hypothetical protein